MIAPWQAFGDEIARWHDAGKAVEFWWRDDDAARPNAAVRRLASLAAQARVPLGLAVIPARAEAGLFDALGAEIAVLQHGVDHRNRAPGQEKPTEFHPSESAALATARIAEGRQRLEELAGSRLLPVLVPPWNRFRADLLASLTECGIRGFSAFAPRSCAQPLPSLIQVNAHVDIIAWKRGRVFAGEERALAAAVAHLSARRSGTVDVAEPTGWLTHHERHDEATWSFLERLFEQTSHRAGVRWLPPADAFSLRAGQ